MSDPDNLAPAILFVDDEATAVKYFQRAIGGLAPVVTAKSVEEGKRMLEIHGDTLLVLVSDQRMPGAYGNELLEFAKNRYPDIIRILTTAYSEIEHTVAAVNEGQIYRYLQKPWEISALRMELKQALDVASLRKEHAQLLREKLMIRQQQLIANRIGMLYPLCANASNSSPLETYLSAAQMAGVKAPEPDWLIMDFADLVSAEAFRSRKLETMIASELEKIRTRYPDSTKQNMLAALVDLMDGAATLVEDDVVAFHDGRILTEFLESPSDAEISQRHACWLAYLLWLNALEYALGVTRSETCVQCQLTETNAGKFSPVRLATWIEQFSW